MAGSVIRQLVTRILFKSDPTGLKKVTTHTSAMKRQMRAASRAAFTLRRDLRGLAFGVRSLVAVMVASRIAKVFTSDFATAADEAAKFADGLGISTEAYQKMTFAAGLAGLSLKEINTALPNLAKRAGDAADGSKEAALAFARANTEVKELGKLKDPIRLMTDLAEGMKTIKDEGRRTQILMNIFGRSGKKMGVFLSQGAEGIKKAMREAKKLGFVLSRAEQKIAEDYNDEMLRTKMVLTGLRNQIAVKLLPAITKNMKAFVRWAKEGDNLKRGLAALVKTLKVLGVVLATVAAVKLGQTLATLVSITKKAVFWTQLQGRATLIAYAPYIAIAAAIAALVLVIQSLVVWSQGGKSAIGDLFEHFGIADKARLVMEGFRRALVAFVAFLPTAEKHILRVVTAMHKVLSALWSEFGADLTELGGALVALFQEVYPVMVSLASEATTIMVKLIHAIGKAWREDVKPAVIEVGTQLVALWIAAKPGLAAIWGLVKQIGALFIKMSIESLPAFGKVIKAVFSGISAAIKASIAQITIFVKMVTFIVSQLRTAFNLMLAVMGLQTAGPTGVSAAVAAGAAVKPRSNVVPTGTFNKTITVGSLNVQVQGTANMTQAEFQAAIEDGTNRVFQREINSAFGAVQSLVPG